MKLQQETDIYTVKYKKRIYGLPQAGIIAQEFLKERIAKHGYTQRKIIHGLWKHKTRPTCFTLVVGNFTVKYTNEQDAEHLISMLKQDYDITIYLEATKYIGLTIEWDLKKQPSPHAYVGAFWKKPSFVSNMKHPRRNKIHCIPTFAQITEPKKNTPKWKLPPPQPNRCKIHPSSCRNTALLRPSS
jgi:hypothetical protein